MDIENPHQGFGTSVEEKAVPTSEVLPAASTPMSSDEEKLASRELEFVDKDHKIYLTGWRLHLLTIASVTYNLS